MTELDDNNVMVRRTATLSTGQIETEHHSGTQHDGLYGFGERINPRRSFVFVSRVLGRHIPVRPTVARQAFTSLADQLPADLQGPILMTSMAETAVGLGAGVHDAYLQRTQRHDVLNFSSTRTARPQAIFGRFSEDHSHASGHTLYVPALEHDQALLSASRTLVMVDDETSSGNTFRSLGATLNAAGLNRFERVITLTLTDWSSETITVASTAVASGQLEAERFSLLAGRYTWTADPDAAPMTLPDPDVPSSLACIPVHRAGDARIGNSTRTRITVPDALLECLEHYASDKRPVLILGTGEHVWEPFLLAEAIEQAGHGVKFSSTTRSPILTHHDIASAYSFRDHESLGITNYLYNVNPVDYSMIVICVDTRVDNIDMSLVLALEAHLVFDNHFIEHQSLIANARSLKPATLKLRHD
ncbi:MAG: phosphoribosyltransferase domain-containing protein [Granulosicoccus sp.]